MTAAAAAAVVFVRLFAWTVVVENSQYLGVKGINNLNFIFIDFQGGFIVTSNGYRRGTGL